MPANRFGGVDQPPLYNATGRLNRGQAVKPAPFSAPNSGAARNWGSQEMPGSDMSPIVSSLSNYFAPINLYDMARMADSEIYTGKRRGERDGGGAGGGGDDLSPDATLEQTQQYLAGQGINIDLSANFGEQGRFANVKNMGQTVTGQPQAQGAAKTPRQRKPLTDEQKLKRNEAARARRSAAKGSATSPAAPASPTAPSQTPGKTVGGSSNVSADTFSASQTYSPSVSIGGAGSSGGRSYAPQAPGGASISFGPVTGGAVNAPAPKPRAAKPRAPKKAGK